MQRCSRESREPGDDGTGRETGRDGTGKPISLLKSKSRPVPSSPATSRIFPFAKFLPFRQWSKNAFFFFFCVCERSLWFESVDSWRSHLGDEGHRTKSWPTFYSTSSQSETGLVVFPRAAELSSVLLASELALGKFRGLQFFENIRFLPSLSFNNCKSR